MKLIPLFLLGIASVAAAQEQRPTQLPQQTQQPQQTAQPRATRAIGIEVKLSGGWYQPKLTPLNDNYSELERILGYRPWGASKIPYLGGLEVRYPVIPTHYVIGEAAGSFVTRATDDDRSWATIWRGGVGYRFEFLNRPVGASVQVTGGLLRASFSRSYNAGAVYLNSGESSWYISGSAAATYPIFSWVAAEFSAGYMFAPKLKMEFPDVDLDVKAPVISLGLVVDVL